MCKGVNWGTGEQMPPLIFSLPKNSVFDYSDEEEKIIKLGWGGVKDGSNKSSPSF
jgi:hypothetical protein